MVHRSPDLMAAYTSGLNALLSAERQSLRCLSKMSFAAYTDELRKGLLPASFDQPQHLERLKQCLKLARFKPSKNEDEQLRALFSQAESARKSSKAPSLTRDLELLHCGLKILSANQAAFHEIQLMAAVLGQDHAAQLLTVCWKDYQNASAYLLQIAANILYPAALNHQQEEPSQKSA